MSGKAIVALSPTESIECPLCAGAGELSRAEILDRLGVKDFARVAQLSAEEAFRLLTQKHRHEEQNAWARFETELAKRTAEIKEHHKDTLRSAQSERDDLTPGESKPLVTRDETQLRQVDSDSRWCRKDGIWLLRTTRQWIVRDLDLLKPIFERMRVQGFDLLDRNAVLAEELRRTFPEIDRIEKELGRAAKAIQSVSALIIRYRERLRDLCDTASSAKVAAKPERESAVFKRVR